MKIKLRKKGRFRETAASSDLAFILIIYFLVIAGFNVNLGFLMNLPERASTRIVQRDELMRFELDHRGAIFYQGMELSIDEAERRISSSLAERPNLALVLSIDGDAPWQEVVSFVELAQKLQVESFSFNIRREHENQS